MQPVGPAPPGFDTMLIYRAYIVGQDSRVSAMHPVLAKDDVGALTAARRLGGDVELWYGLRYVGDVRNGTIYPPTPPH